MNKEGQSSNDPQVTTDYIIMLTQKNVFFLIVPPSFRWLLLIAFLRHLCQIGMRPDPSFFVRVWLARPILAIFSFFDVSFSKHERSRDIRTPR